MKEDCKPFNIQGHTDASRTVDREIIRYPNCTIPWWLAEIAYKQYSKLYGTQQSLERLHERGGFGREELMSLLRGEHP